MAFPNTMKRMTHGLQDMGNSVSQRAHETWEQVGETAGELYEQGRDRVRHVADEFGDSLHDHPMRWMLIGVGIGCLMGAMLVRR